LHVRTLLNTMALIIQIPINVDAPDNPPLQEWVEREWIGVGKKYPISSEVPTFAHHSVPIYVKYVDNIVT
jgi:hypothetical protein